MHSAIRRTTRTGPILVVIAIGFLFTWHVVPIRGQNLLDTARERAKERYNFDAWAGRTKTNLIVQSLTGLPAELESQRRIRVDTPDNERADKLSIELLEDSSTSGGRLYVAICSSPRDAQEALFRGFIALSSTPDYVMGKESTPFDIGDVCLYSIATNLPGGVLEVAGRPFIGRLYFSRNNVAVKIINNSEPGKKHLDVLAVAKFVDYLLAKEGADLPRPKDQ
jgi:hypothetical protein